MKSLRKWATPLTVGSFLIMSVTGILMFFHIDSGLNGFVHEWAGWAMVAGVMAHLVLNWRAFTVYFKRPAAKALMGAGALVLALSFIPATGGGSPVQSVMEALAHTDVQTVIALSGQDLDTGLQLLADAGIETQADTPMQTVTGGERRVEMQVIKTLFTN